MELPRAVRRPVPWQLLAIAAAAAMVTALCIAIVDQPVARVIAAHPISPVWDRVVRWLEWTIGFPIWRLLLPVVLVAGMIATAAIPRWRGAAPAWMLLAGTHLVSRLAMVYLKEGTGRLRPPEWLAQGGDTFCRDGLSFPSGHVVQFASIAIPLAVLAPRTRPLLVIPAYVMVARVAINVHFVADVTGAIALVALATWAVGWLVRPCRS